MELRQTIERRKSVREFDPERPLPLETVREIIDAARRAPSWSNTQPWFVAALSGPKVREMSREMRQAATTRDGKPTFMWPITFEEPYKSRRRANGYALYDAIGIERSDKPARFEQMLRNYDAFDAPVVLFFCMHKDFGHYPAVDLGAFMMLVMLLAEEKGVATCAQAILSNYPDIVRKYLDIPDDQGIVFGMAMGYEIQGAPINEFSSDRAPLDELFISSGFDQ